MADRIEREAGPSAAAGFTRGLNLMGFTASPISPFQPDVRAGPGRVGGLAVDSGGAGALVAALLE
jgi:hypothetical protein